jgi:hypothetical protein
LEFWIFQLGRWWCCDLRQGYDWFLLVVLLLLLTVLVGGGMECYSILVLYYFCMASLAVSDSIENQFFVFLLTHKDKFCASGWELLSISNYVVTGSGCLFSTSAVNECLSVAWFVFHGEMDLSTSDFNKRGWDQVNELRSEWLSFRSS